MSKKEESFDRIYNHVKDQIMSKRIFPGSHIVEDDLAKNAGVSRALVRNVMSVLQAEGFVKIIPNRGTFVIKPTQEDVTRIFHTRRYLELGAAALAVERITPEAIARLEENYAAQLKLKERFSITEYARLNRAFHWEIALASGNEYYTRYLNEIYNIVHIYMIFYDKSIDNTRSLESHRLMLQSMKEHDFTKAEQAILADSSIGTDDLKVSFGNDM